MKVLSFLIAVMALYSANCTATYVYSQCGYYRPVATHCSVVEKRIYHYYPDLEIYWCPSLASYACFENGLWVVTLARPAILTPMYTHVVIETELHDPWRQHEHYRTIYPRRQVVHRMAPVVVRYEQPNVVIYDRNRNDRDDHTQGRHADHDRGDTYIVRENNHNNNIIINPPRPDVKNGRTDNDQREKERNDHSSQDKVKTNDHNRDGHADNGWVNNPRDDRKVIPAQNNRDKEKNRNSGDQCKRYTHETKGKTQSNGNADNSHSVGAKKVAKSPASRGHISKR